MGVVRSRCAGERWGATREESFVYRLFFQRGPWLIGSMFGCFLWEWTTSLRDLSLKALIDFHFAVEGTADLSNNLPLCSKLHSGFDFSFYMTSRSNNFRLEMSFDCLVDCIFHKLSRRSITVWNTFFVVVILRAMIS